MAQGGAGGTRIQALSSEDFLEFVDEAIFTVAEKTGVRKVVNTITERFFNWARRSSPWLLELGIMCCAIEMAATGAPRFDMERFGVAAWASPRQCDILLVNGPISRKFKPRIKTLWDQMPEPKWCICMGECAICGGPYWDSYAVVGGADTFIPVDVYIPGCPVRPEALIHGFLTLEQKIKEEKWEPFLSR